MWVYDGEVHDRSKSWWIIAMVVIISLIIISLFTKNFVGAIILIFMVGVYTYHTLSIQKKVFLQITNMGVSTGKSMYSWNELVGFVLEYNKKTGDIKNIVFLTSTMKYTHTLADNFETIESFVSDLSQIIPLMPSYNLSFSEKIIKLLKI